MNALELPISIIVVSTSEGMKHYVTLTPSSHAFEAGVIPEAIVGVLLRPTDQVGGITPDNFARNSVFVDFLHGVIAEHGPSVPGLVAEAKRKVEGWVYIIDGRAPSPQGLVSPEDIIGAFQVKGGEVVPGSYQRNGNHAVLSSNGFFRLESVLREKLCSALSERA
jgi:hypothetical protein